jgi:hypothetical protein
VSEAMRWAESSEEVRTEAQIDVLVKALDGVAKLKTETRRDDLAQAAMQGMLASPQVIVGGLEAIATLAYRMADAMLEERLNEPFSLRKVEAVP